MAHAPSPDSQPEAAAAIALLLDSHNDGKHYPAFERPCLGVVTCMDFRIRLRLPENFAFVLRTGGANPRPVEPYLAYGIVRTGVHALALIGHTDCAMERPDPDLIDTLRADDELKRHYHGEIAALAIADAATFTRREAARLQERFGFPVAPLLYRTETHRLELL